MWTTRTRARAIRAARLANLSVARFVMRPGRRAVVTSTRRRNVRARPAARRASVQHTRRAPRGRPPPSDVTGTGRGRVAPTPAPGAVPVPRAETVSEYVSSLPCRTVRRPARLRNTSAGARVATAPFTSPSSLPGDVTAVTPLRSTPGAVARATTVTDALAPGASAPSSQTIGTAGAQVPWLGVTERTWSRGSGVSVTTTALAAPAPAFVA